MNYNPYKLAGTVKIPEEKRKEFNQKVMMLLDKGGIRLTKKIDLAGREVTVVTPVKPDENGIVSFDYSIFEKEKRNISSFNLSTGELNISDNGYFEYTLIINLIMILQSAYSCMPCYFVKNGKPVKIDAYMDLIDTMLESETEACNSSSVWDIYSFFHYNNEYKDIEIIDAFHACRNWIMDMDRAMFVVDMMGEDIKLTEEVASMERKDIGNAGYGHKREYLFRLFKKHLDDPDLEDHMKDILSSELESRRSMSLADDVYGEIAELSQYFASQVVAKTYAISKGEDFWTVWDRLNIEGYSESIPDPDLERGEQEKYTLNLYRAIKRESEDEFLEWWDGSNLNLSSDLKDQMAIWKESLDHIEVPEEFDMEKTLADVLWDMEKVWQCRYVDDSFVYEFLDQKNDKDHHKMLLVLREYLDEGTQMFQELTKEQAVKWILTRARESKDRVFMAAYTSWVTNHMVR